MSVHSSVRPSICQFVTLVIHAYTVQDIKTFRTIRYGDVSSLLTSNFVLTRRSPRTSVWKSGIHPTTNWLSTLRKYDEWSWGRISQTSTPYLAYNSSNYLLRLNSIFTRFPPSYRWTFVRTAFCRDEEVWWHVELTNATDRQTNRQTE